MLTLPAMRLLLRARRGVRTSTAIGGAGREPFGRQRRG